MSRISINQILRVNFKPISFVQRTIFYAFMLLLLSLPSVRLTAQDTAADYNLFGVVEGFWLPDVVCELHPGWERIIFDWAEHQPNGPDDWYTLNVDDRWLKAAAGL